MNVQYIMNLLIDDFRALFHGRQATKTHMKSLKQVLTPIFLVHR